MDATFVSHNNTTEVIVNFFADSTTRGAVMNYASISASGVVNFTSSVLLTLERINDTATTFIDLYPGEYSVYFYDIEQDGQLSLGEGYPAVTDQVLASGNKQGYNTQNPPNILHATLLIWGTTCMLLYTVSTYAQAISPNRLRTSLFLYCIQILIVQ